MSSSNCCFLNCIQVSQEAGQVVWYSHLLKNFPVYCDHVLKYKETEVQIIFCNKVFLCACLPSLFSHVQLFVTPRTAAHQAPLSSTVSWSLLKFTSIEPVMPSNPLILCHPLFLLPSIFLRFRVFSNWLALMQVRKQQLELDMEQQSDSK